MFEIRPEARCLTAITVAAILLTVLAASVTADGSDAVTSDAESYYYNLLDDDEKRIYDGFKNATVENPSFSLTYTAQEVGDDANVFLNSETSKYSEVLGLFRQENLYAYWIGTGLKTAYSGTTGSGGTVTVTITDLMTDYGKTNDEVASNCSKIRSEISDLSAKIDTSSTFAKVQSIHAIVAEMLKYYEYSPERPIPEDMTVRNIATAFLGGSYQDPAEVVCEGYAKTFKAICDAYDVPCIIVTGQGVTSSGSEGHMWNYVRMDDGNWYLVDCTWDDQSDLLTDFFLVGSGTEAAHFSNTTVGASHVTDGKYDMTGMAQLASSQYGRPAYSVVLRDGDDHIVAPLFYDTGDTVVVPITPYKADTKTTDYTFLGWSDNGTIVESFPKVSGNAEYKEEFSQTQMKYSVIFQNYDGTVISDNVYEYNAPIAVPTTNPTRATDGYASYTFLGWSSDGTSVATIGRVSEDVTYTALYQENVFTYTVTFRDYDGTKISETDYTYGQEPVLPEDPVREPTNTTTYAFKEWNSKGDGTGHTPAAVTDSVSYYAIYTESTRYYSVTLIDADGSALGSYEYTYNSPLTLPEGYVSFVSDPELPSNVIVDGTYTAKLSIKMDAAGNFTARSNSNAVNFDTDQISALKGTAGTLTVDLTVASIVFDNAAKQSLGAGNTLLVNERSFSYLSAPVQEELRNATVYSISYGNGAPISGTATVTFPFIPSDDQDLSDIRIYSVDGDSLTKLESTYNSGRLTFSTDRFSTYAIQTPEESKDISNLLSDYYVVIVILLVAVLGIIIAYRRG